MSSSHCDESAERASERVVRDMVGPVYVLSRMCVVGLSVCGRGFRDRQSRLPSESGPLDNSECTCLTYSGDRK
jgi:hypothetical protein